MLTFGELKYGKRQATLAEVLSWADTVIDNVENTETGWGNCGPQIINAAGDRLAVVVDFNLKPTARKTSQVDVVEYGEGEISAWEGADEQQLKQEEATTDVTLNLQYFFPLCDQALFDDPRREIIFIVTCRDADQWRIRRYLGAQSRVKERLCICTAVLGSRGKTELSIVNYNAEDIGDLFPLLCVGETTYLGNGGNIRKMEDLTIRTLSSSSRELYQYATGKKVSFVHLARYPQYYMLLKAGCHAVDKINEKLMGKVKNEEKIRERQKLQRDFWSIVADQHGGFERQPFLTQVIWLCSLRHLMEQDELRNAEESCTDYFQKSKIYLALWDAVAYGEGILQLLENCELHSQHHMGYLSIYFHDVGLKKVSSINDAAARRTRIFRKYRMKRSDSIVQPDESCYMEFNVTDMGRDKAYRAKGIEVTSGHELSALFGGLTEDTIENAVHHYGMPLFFRTVMRKCGRFICSTPDGKQTVKQYLAGKYADKDNSPDPQCFQRSSQQAWTSYQILLPVTFRGYMLDEVKADHTQMFDAALMNEPVMPQDYRQKWINETLFLKNNRILSVDAKIREAKDIGNVLLDSAEKENINTTVFYLNFKGLSAINVELYIKGVFHFIAQKKISGEECKRILLRLVFSDEFALSEALRRFAIFYDRFGKSRWMKDVQVALCVQDQENAEQQNSQVRLILAGEHIYEAYITAKQYMHYNVDLTSGFLLSQVEYLTSCEKDKGLGKGAEKGVTGVPVFPFDLVKGADGKSDFLKKMEMQLQSDLQKQGYGCKITDAHIRLGSKIHIRDFYDAELLFQSIGNVYRFAYLLAGSMIQELRKSKSADISTLLLIGYESYSAVLVNEVKRLLEQLLQAAQEEKIKIEHLQYIKEHDDSERIVYLGYQKKWELREIDQKTACVIILPIGTTLSTIYKIRNVFQREYKLKEKPRILINHALVIVGNSAPDSQVLVDDYWKEAGEYVVLEPETAEGPEKTEKPEEMKVHWLLNPKTEWMAPENCRLCGCTEADAADDLIAKHVPLGQVDKTSTIPGLIFPTTFPGMKHGIGFTAEGENWDRIKWLEGCIEYGHIQKDANHFQFYIDYPEYYRKVRPECIGWLKKKRLALKENEFNIIISPLQYDNSLFVKDVVDHVFQHSLRFIYLSLDQTYREEIRSRFSYIAKEYRDACGGAVPPKYNVCYVDYSLVSGQSLRRAEQLIRMLINDAGISADVQVFRKVILLTNRSSYDTAAVYVQNPEADFIAFSTLVIPSYNTMSNHCPACEMVETYRTIAKCSATNELYWHYHDLAQKHHLHSAKNYMDELREFHFAHEHYLQRFCQSLLCELDVKDKATRKEILDVIAKTVEDKEEEGVLASKVKLNTVVHKFKKEELKVRKCYDLFIQKRNWRRLVCTHQAMELIENHYGLCWDGDEVSAEIWRVIWQGVQESLTIAEKREWLISYIKAFSREYPAKVAPVRQAIYLLMEALLMDLLEQELSEDQWRAIFGEHYQEEKVKEINELLRIDRCGGCAEHLQLYQLYQTLAKRLCDLQSNLLLRHDVLKSVDVFLQALRDSYNRAKDEAIAEGTTETKINKYLLKVIDFPGDERLQTDYLHLIKWAAMSSKEESKAFLVQQLTQSIAKDIREKKTNPLHYATDAGQGIETSVKSILNCAEFGEIVQQENTRVLYSGIKRLGERINEDGPWKEFTKKIGLIWKGARDGQRNGRYLAQNPMADLFRFMDADLGIAKEGREECEYTELLAALKKFYSAVTELNEERVQEERKNYVEKYTEICFCFAKIGGYKNCCMVHRRNDENIIISQYLSNECKDPKDEIDLIINRADSDLKEKKLKNTVADYSGVEDPSKKALVLALRINRRDDVEYMQTIYVVLFGKTGGAVDQSDALHCSHYVLFMRQQLQRILERDLYALHHFRIGLQDIKRINSSKKQSISVLHLTDLHISIYNYKAIINLVRSHASGLQKGCPELMVVTGDVVQGNNAGVDLEENYRCAAEVLRAIAEVLWVEPGIDAERVLRSDWKKRIIIIPGNHDYASMNELEANHTLRATTGGVPVRRNGSPMSKYAYYIQFLQDFLGISSTHSVRNNLNDIYVYPELKLRVIALNSVAEVGPVRNNKMQLDESYINKKVDGISKGTKRIPDDYFTILLAHHTPCYKPDYFADQYWEKGMTDEIIDLAKEILEICLSALRRMGGTCAEEREELRTQTDERIGKVIGYDKPQEYSVFQKDFGKSTLFSDVSYIREHWWERTNERCAQIFADYKRNESMAQNDLMVYEERLAPLKQLYPFDAVLGGHTHQAGIAIGKENELCIEGAQFYSEAGGKTQLNYGRLDLIGKGGSKEVKYSFGSKVSTRTLTYPKTQYETVTLDGENE